MIILRAAFIYCYATVFVIWFFNLLVSSFDHHGQIARKVLINKKAFKNIRPLMNTTDFEKPASTVAFDER